MTKAWRESTRQQGGQLQDAPDQSGTATVTPVKVGRFKIQQVN